VPGNAWETLKNLVDGESKGRKLVGTAQAEATERAAGAPAVGSPRGIKRYNLALPEELFNELQELAERKQTSVVDILRRSIKLGLLAASLEETPDSAIIIRRGGVEREIVLI
jgi:hypothetical protein